MKKIALILLVSLLFHFGLAQKTNHFSLPLPETKKASSLYSDVTVIDARYDTSSMGRLWFGIVNDQSISPAPVSVPAQITAVIQQGLGSQPNKQGLLVHVRFFKFSDRMGKYEHEAYCYFRAGFYAKQGDVYSKIIDIDTSILLTIGRMQQSPKKFFNHCGRLLTGIITSQLEKAAAKDKTYTLYDILHTDSIEKSVIPVYNTANFQAGVYNNYPSFKTQSPDYNIAAIDTTAEGDIKEVFAFNAKGKKIKVDKNAIYAMIHDNTIWFVIKPKYVPAVKIDDDFFLTGDLGVTGVMSEGKQARRAILGGLTQGAAGALIGSLANKETLRKRFQMKIDHIDGMPIKMKEIETEEEKKARLRAETEAANQSEEATEE